MAAMRHTGVVSPSVRVTGLLGMGRMAVYACALLAMLAVWAGPASASYRPVESVRGLVCDAADVVVAEPLDPLYSQDKDTGRILPLEHARFRVERVVKGDDARAGATIDVSLGKDYIVCLPTYSMDSLKPQIPDIDRVVLYLGQPSKDGVYAPLMSGLHGIAADGTALLLSVIEEPSRYCLTPVVAPTGKELLAEVDREAAALEHLQQLSRIPDPAKRNSALLAWITEHLDELGEHQYVHLEVVMPRPETGPAYRLRTDGAGGWGTVNKDVFRWVMESKVPADCWRALVLYGVAHPDSPDMDWEGIGFCTPEGRAILLEKAQDGSLSPRVRRTALRRLAWGPTLWYRYPYDAPLDAGSVTEPERARLLDAAIALMQSPAEEVRSAADLLVFALGSTSYSRPSPETAQRALQASIDAYRSAPFDSPRALLARNILYLGGMEKWQEVTGNTAPVAAALDPLRLTDGRYWGELEVGRGAELLRKRPAVVFERLDVTGKAVDTLQMPLPLEPPQDGWTPPAEGSIGFRLKFPALKLEPGTWRVHAEGKTDDGSWASEATFLHIDL